MIINLGWGILLWFSATILFRFFGQLFLVPGDELLLIISFIIAIPMIALAIYPYYFIRKIPSSKRLITSVQIALPGMLLDILSIIYFEKVFTNLHVDSLPFFASWLLWAYSLILLSGIKKEANSTNAHVL